MENEANGLADSFVARHTTDPALRQELLSRSQNGSRQDQISEMGSEIGGSNNIATDSPATGSPPTVVFPTNSQAASLFALSLLNIRPWNVESLESSNNSPLALVQGVATATVQMNRVMHQREQRELEHQEQLRRERLEAETGMRRGRASMIDREVDLIYGMDSLSFVEQRVEGASTSVTRRINVLANGTGSHQFPKAESNVIGFLLHVRSSSNVVGSCQHSNSDGSGTHTNCDLFAPANEERNTVGSNTKETCVQRSGGSVTNRNYYSESMESTGNSLLELEQRAEDACAMVQRVLKERERKEFGREIERKEHEIRAERAQKKRGRENLTGEGSGRQRWIQEKSKIRPQSEHDECCICLKDAFSGCQILPCSHKVHRECVITMIQNGVRSCPICRQALFGSAEYSSRQTGNHT
ncbi:hypothetical protein AWC38_SpisGene14428 [Stylophora pistillata]|uniref:RING-type domain-containing protein n=1 Tax=Stylophora pistillata TaxID=50429 RepID=A0A2B4RWE2_STYPI|nr:hypothetical protein AWC38_SpisGene14428 [Stylophora pistillata]